MSYHGWKNYATWAVYTWLSNDPGSEEFAREAVRGLSISRAAESLKNSIEELNPCNNADLYGDLMTWALEQVDWREVAKAFKNYE